MWIHMPTNQIGMDEPTARAIYECVSWVYLSMDGIGDDLSEIRGIRSADSLFSDTLRSLHELRRVDPGGGKPGQRIICNTTVSRFNVDTLEQIAEYACRMGCDEIHFEPAGEMTREAIAASSIDGKVPRSYFVRDADPILMTREQATLLRRRLREIKRRFGDQIDVSEARPVSEAQAIGEFAHLPPVHRRCSAKPGGIPIHEAHLPPAHQGKLAEAARMTDGKQRDRLTGTFTRKTSSIHLTAVSAIRGA
jgi:hypothetical protein